MVMGIYECTRFGESGECIDSKDPIIYNSIELETLFITLGISKSRARKYAYILDKDGVGSYRRLKKRISANRLYLQSIGITDQEDIQDILHEFSNGYDYTSLFYNACSNTFSILMNTIIHFFIFLFTLLHNFVFIFSYLRLLLSTLLHSFAFVLSYFFSFIFILNHLLQLIRSFFHDTTFIRELDSFNLDFVNRITQVFYETYAFIYTYGIYITTFLCIAYIIFFDIVRFRRNAN
jgi:hypothetical protein